MSTCLIHLMLVQWSTWELGFLKLTKGLYDRNKYLLEGVLSFYNILTAFNFPQICIIISDKNIPPSIIKDIIPMTTYCSLGNNFQKKKNELSVEKIKNQL